MSKKIHIPPTWLDTIIACFIGRQHLDVIRGDLHEIYQNNVQQKGKFMASVNYLADVISCLRSPLREKRVQYKISFPMFNNYLKLSVRNLLRNKTFTLVNIFGLTLSFTISIIIFLFVRTELSYDKYHVKADRIYRLNYDLTQRNEKKPWAITTGRWPELAHSELEAVKDFVRIIPSWGNKSLLKYNEKRFYESSFGWADPSLTRIFDFQFLEGDPETALNEPHTIIITTRIAEKYFGQSSAIGKSINRDDETDYLITGVIEEIPANSHFHLDFIASLMSATAEERARFWSYSYLLLKDGASPKMLEANLQDLLEKHSDKSKDARLTLLPLNDIHLKSDMMYEFESNGDAKTVYIFSVIAVFILLIACINFINLYTAQSVKRVKEIGVRKVMGALRNELIWQHLTESMTISFISFITALVLVKISLPLINELTGTVIINDLFTNLPLVLLIIFVAIVTGLLAGSYPAFFISSFTPKQIFRPSNTIKGNSLLRKILVVFQFSLSVFLIIGSITVYRQIEFFQNKNLGFSKEQVLAIPIRFADNIKSKYESFRNEALQIPGVENLSMMSNLPGELIQMWVGSVKLKGNSSDELLRVKWFTSDYDFVKTLDIKIADGRDFSRDYLTDSSQAVLINQTAAKLLNLTEPIGKVIEIPSRDKSMEIIGVVEDFHFASLHNDIEPLLIFMEKRFFGKLAVKISTGNIIQTVADLEQTWNKFEPERPMESFFLDQYFDEKYKKENVTMNLVLMFTVMGIIIACLGLYALAIFVMDMRLKEISIRKVLGASTLKVFGILTSEFTLLVLIAFIIISPLAYYFITFWLSEFAYRVELNLFTFLFAGLITWLISFLTISYKSLVVARSNPVDALKDE